MLSCGTHFGPEFEWPTLEVRLVLRLNLCASVSNAHLNERISVRRISRSGAQYYLRDWSNEPCSDNFVSYTAKCAELLVDENSFAARISELTLIME